MRAGDLNRRITVQSIAGTKTENGYAVETWADGLSLWAEVVDKNGREFFSAQRINAEITALFKTRNIGGIDTKMRIKLGSRIFNILSVDADSDKSQLSITAKEVL